MSHALRNTVYAFTLLCTWSFGDGSTDMQGFQGQIDKNNIFPLLTIPLLPVKNIPKYIEQQQYNAPHFGKIIQLVGPNYVTYYVLMA